MEEKNHIYNLKAVTNEVGLTPATLRAWERRYDVLKPERSAGGHRLYSRQEIEMLKWLVQRQKEGLSISRAVEMWKSQPRNIQHGFSQPPEPVSSMWTGGSLVDELRDSWLAACMVFDDQSANRALDQAFAIAPPDTICAGVLLKGLAIIGERWYAGSASVQHEHFASAIAGRRVNTVMAAAVPPSRPERILVACPPGEQHGFVLLLVAYLLRRRGWDAVYLGSDVPLKDLDVTMQAITPALVISAAQTLPTAANLRVMSASVAMQGIHFAYGGGIFAQNPVATGGITGYYLGDDVVQVAQTVENRIISPSPMPTAPTVSPKYDRLLQVFKQNEAKVNAFVNSAEKFNPSYLEIANQNLFQLITSALILGEISYASTSLNWLAGLLSNRGISATELNGYYLAYSQAVESCLGAEGALIHDWLVENS